MNWLNSFGKMMGSFTVGWVDFLALLVVCLGIVRGRKRGLSEELLDTTMWIIIILTAGFCYHNLGNLMSRKPFLSNLTYYMMSYILIALVIKIVFTLIKKKFGQKMVESDIFGRLEYYGVFFFLVSLLHAPHYSEEFLAKRAIAVDYNYGSDFFPHPCKIQKAVFQNSFIGMNAEKHLAMLLIEQTEGNSKAIRDESSMGRRNERKIDAIMRGR
jgi:hypothetical protein